MVAINGFSRISIIWGKLWVQLLLLSLHHATSPVHLFTLAFQREIAKINKQQIAPDSEVANKKHSEIIKMMHMLNKTWQMNIYVAHS